MTVTGKNRVGLRIRRLPQDEETTRIAGALAVTPLSARLWSSGNEAIVVMAFALPDEGNSNAAALTVTPERLTKGMRPWRRERNAQAPTGRRGISAACLGRPILANRHPRP